MASKELEAQKAAQMEMHRALKMKRDVLREKLEAKVALLKEICLKESVSGTVVSTLRYYINVKINYIDIDANIILKCSIYLG